MEANACSGSYQRVVLDSNIWNYVTVSKQMIIIKLE